ncbi:short-chain dehydrogenase [Thozetella sp. PMI_491]|nr:short-chain dehydrogenase [Thozetella sp. PMI_491]
MAGLIKGAAFITGAASGIGKQTALAFSRHGVQKLALADINGATLQETAKILNDQFPHVQTLCLQLDVSNLQEVKKAIGETVKRFGRLDIAVNNAGVGGAWTKTHEIDEAEWKNVLGIDLHGVWNCQREELAIMLDQEHLGTREGRGVIINVASIYGLVGPSRDLFHTAYTSAKHGVIGLTKADANTYGPDGIRINAVCPGYVETPLLLKSLAGNPKSVIHLEVENTAFKRLGKPEEIADAITFLASPMSSFVQGASLAVDGGFSAR